MGDVGEEENKGSEEIRGGKLQEVRENRGRDSMRS